MLNLPPFASRVRLVLISVTQIEIAQMGPVDSEDRKREASHEDVPDPEKGAVSMGPVDSRHVDLIAWQVK